MAGGWEMRGVFVDPVVCMTVAEVSTEEVSEAFAVVLQHLIHECTYIYILVCCC